LIAVGFSKPVSDGSALSAHTEIKVLSLKGQYTTLIGAATPKTTPNFRQNAQDVCSLDEKNVHKAKKNT
jgi:hypothetical protein